LSEGHSRAEAEAAIADLLALVSAVKDASLELTRHNDRLQLDFKANFTAAQ
jgi:hypothetical protein